MVTVFYFMRKKLILPKIHSPEIVILINLSEFAEKVKNITKFFFSLSRRRGI